MLKDGTLVIADEQLRTAVQYALERAGRINKSQTKSRRSSVATAYFDYDYYDQFKVVRSDDGGVDVINGADPESEYCGATDLTNDTAEGWSRVPRKHFTFQEISIGKEEGFNHFVYVRLGAIWNKESGYQNILYLGNNRPSIFDEADRYIYGYDIAGLEYGKSKKGEYVGIFQVHKSGPILFGNSYII